MPIEYHLLLRMLRRLVANDPDDLAVLDCALASMALSWPGWRRHLHDEQEVLRLVQQVRAGTI